MKKQNTLYPVLFALLLTGGCTSLNGVVHERTHPFNGEPLYYSLLSEHYGSPAEMIAQATVQEIKLIHRTDGYQDTFPDTTFDASYVPTNAGAKIDLTWNSQDCLFPPGEYDINTVSTLSYNRREGLAFIDLARKAVNLTVNRLKDAGITRYRIEAAFTGKADGLPVNHIFYRGEYGRVRLQEKTTLNGMPHIFTIYPGQTISNEELAALRAVSFASLMHGWLGTTQIEDRFDIQTSSHVGLQYRSVSVSITIFNN